MKNPRPLIQFPLEKTAVLCFGVFQLRRWQRSDLSLTPPGCLNWPCVICLVVEPPTHLKNISASRQIGLSPQVRVNIKCLIPPNSYRKFMKIWGTMAIHNPSLGHAGHFLISWGAFWCPIFLCLFGDRCSDFPGGKKLGHLRKVVMISVFDMYVLTLMMLLWNLVIRIGGGFLGFWTGAPSAPSCRCKTPPWPTTLGQKPMYEDQRQFLTPCGWHEPLNPDWFHDPYKWLMCK